MDYDLADAAGAGDAFFNREIAPADRTLVNSANKVIQKSREGALDNIKGKPVSPETASTAKVVRGFFGWILSAPALKGELPKRNVKPDPHNIK
ncbi:hypothetical protein [Flavihumibacter sp. UBA7668]|uniref:hypothetical protein n=1 Tax=Flavihumibacter sp. UBA7668 TaxID=1946542 RepID=UPI0025BD52DA|nr:hypothetical protein [Flavihumibacter sp. UBA7668]